MQLKTIVITSAIALVAASNAASAQQSQASQSRAVSQSPQYSESMEHLQKAAQRLRETIQALAQQKPGPEREAALKTAREALWDAQQAMIRLPPQLRQAPETPASVGATGVATDYEKSMTRLQQAADRLRQSVQSMATQDAGERRNQAMAQARASLLETEQAMLHLPLQVASAGRTATSTEGKAGRAQKTGNAGPLIVLVAPATLGNDTFANGCWARLYGEENFEGDVLTIAGPGDFAYLRTDYANFQRKWDSVAVGPKATLTTYDHDNFTQRVATFKSGQRVADLDEKLGFFENIRSVRIACGK